MSEPGDEGEVLDTIEAFRPASDYWGAMLAPVAKIAGRIQVKESAQAKLERYEDFIRSKIPLAQPDGFDPVSHCPDWFKPHQRDICNWAIRLGRSGICASFGLGKTAMQLQLAKWVHEFTGGKFLIVAPLGVRQEFTINDGPKMGMAVEYVRNDAEVARASTPYLITNYERVRDGGIDVSQFAGGSLDEAAVLRSYGTKTTQQFQQLFRAVRYRWIATATPSPNDFIELINYAHFLGAMDRGEAMTRFFGRDSKEAGNLQLYPHMENQFWSWVASWAVFLNRPSELGYDDDGYALPPLSVHWHCIDVDYSRAHDEIDKRSGQRRLIPAVSGSVQIVAKERRHTLEDRIARALEIVRSQPDEHWIIWHYLEAERHEIKRQLRECVSIYGTQDLDEREAATIGFANGQFKYVSTKPEVSGSGTNWQRHCARNVYVGPTDMFNDFIQSVHRTYRFLQSKPVEVHVVFAETQAPTVATMQRKWKQHNHQREIMSKLIEKNGLSKDALGRKLARTVGCERQEAKGRSWTAINNDCVPEVLAMKDDSIDCIITSIPFSDHYEYSPSFNDFGHNHGDEGFFQQFDFLVPELYRVMKPGRIACIHTKDRIEYGKMTGNGMYSVREFSDKTVAAFKRHGWIYMGRIVIDTDVVRENAQTYRLGWTENSKDSCKMGVGSCEYVLIFRKWHPSMSGDDPPTANGPHPVRKDKAKYLKARWQIHASGIWRSNGDELLTPEKISAMGVQGLYHWWREYCETHGYDYPTHVQYCEAVDRAGFIPTAMMLFAPHSRNPDVWTDVERIKTLNTELKRKENDSHVCPLQLDVIERLLERYTNKKDIVLDPFGGVMSVPYVCMKTGRRGVGIELNSVYWSYGVKFCKRLEDKMAVPTLFDIVDEVADQADQEQAAGESESAELAMA